MTIKTDIKLYRIYKTNFMTGYNKGSNFETYLILSIIDGLNKVLFKEKYKITNAIYRNNFDIDKLNNTIENKRLQYKGYKFTKEQWEKAKKDIKGVNFGVDANYKYLDEITYKNGMIELNISNGYILNYDNLFKAIVNCLAQDKIKFANKKERKYCLESGRIYINTNNNNMMVLNEEYNKINNTNNIHFNHIDFLSVFFNDLNAEGKRRSPFIEHADIKEGGAQYSFLCFRQDRLRGDNGNHYKQDCFLYCREQFDYARQQFNIED